MSEWRETNQAMNEFLNSDITNEDELLVSRR